MGMHRVYFFKFWKIFGRGRGSLAIFRKNGNTPTYLASGSSGPQGPQGPQVFRSSCLHVFRASGHQGIRSSGPPGPPGPPGLKTNTIQLTIYQSIIYVYKQKNIHAIVKYSIIFLFLTPINIKYL
jgi:hypothetical protein